jgi:hypothetical protein
MRTRLSVQSIAGVFVAAIVAGSCSTQAAPAACGPRTRQAPVSSADTQLHAELLTDSSQIGQFNLFISVINLQAVPTEVEVELDGKSALAILVPRQAEDCDTTAMYRYGLVATPSKVAVRASTDAGHSDAMTVDVSNTPFWIDVQVRSGAVLDLQLFDQPLGWD